MFKLVFSSFNRFYSSSPVFLPSLLPSILSPPLSLSFPPFLFHTSPLLGFFLPTVIPLPSSPSLSLASLHSHTLSFSSLSSLLHLLLSLLNLSSLHHFPLLSLPSPTLARLSIHPSPSLPPSLPPSLSPCRTYQYVFFRGLSNDCGV